MFINHILGLESPRTQAKGCRGGGAQRRQCLCGAVDVVSLIFSQAHSLRTISSLAQGSHLSGAFGVLLNLTMGVSTEVAYEAEGPCALSSLLWLACFP